MGDYKFEGWLAFDKTSGVGGMKWEQFEPKAFEETDVDIEITHCGICGTDLHTLRSGWFPTDYPCCAGHEIVGTVVRVGSKVTEGLRVGTLAGVGSQVGSCSDCEDCASGLENYCSKMVQTYNSRYPNGVKTYGGYATHWRGPAAWIFAIPSSMPAIEAAPMLCGGITLYAPLTRFGCGPGKRVGIIGIGGLGHFGIMFAKALGADKVVALSRGGNKRADALKLGAAEYVATDEDKDWATKHARSLDIIISTVSRADMPLSEYLSLLRTNGAFVQLGAPEDFLPPVNAFSLIGKGVTISGSLIGPPAQVREMLDFAVAHDIHPIVQERAMKDANEAVVEMDKGMARYRYVLVNNNRG